MASAREIRSAIAADLEDNWANAQSLQSFAACYADEAARLSMNISFALEIRAESANEEVEVLNQLIDEWSRTFDTITDELSLFGY